MRLYTILGTRPEIIRLSRVIPKLDALCEHVVVHTGQNFDPRLSDIFFEDLRLRRPDRHLGIQANLNSRRRVGQWWRRWRDPVLEDS